MYNLSTYPGRLKALANGLTLNITPAFNDAILVDMHTLEGKIWAVSNTSFDCTLAIKQNVSLKDFEDACDTITLGGLYRDSLRQVLFGSPRPTKGGVEDTDICLKPEGPTITRPLYQAVAGSLWSPELGGKPC